MPKRKNPPAPKTRRSPLATRPLPPAEPPAAPAPVIEANPTRATLINLLNGIPPANRSEMSLLFKWHHLSKWERYALAFEWGLPHPREEHERLARQAKEKLARVIPSAT